MFQKLLSNLPFNPSLINQVSFYTMRMRQESAIRRTALVFMALTMVVQFFAVMAPPQQSLAASGNDIIPGGVTSKDHAVRWCNDNLEIKTIYAHFGVSCAAIQAGSVVNVGSRNWSSQLYSLGRFPYQKTGEVPVKIGAQTFYMRPLWSWDTAGESTYKAIQGTRADGSPFYIIMNCGNITIVGAPTVAPPPPPPPPPPPTDVCPNVPGTQTSYYECDVCPYRDGIQLYESQCDVCPTNPGVQLYQSECDLCPNIPGQQTSTGECDVCPNRSGTQSSLDECDVCPNKEGVQLSTNDCDVCPNRPGTQTTTDQCDVCPDRPGEQLSTSECDVCPNKPGTQNDENECDVCPNISGIQTDESQCDLCPLIPGEQSNTNECKPCDESQGETDTSSCLELSKTASNSTQDIAQADGTTAKAGDIIVYTLSAKNTGKITVEGFAVEENIGDILDYADVVDLHGGTWDKTTNIVRWVKKDLAAGGTVTETLTVKIKNPIPQTPISSSNPGTGDMTMTNVYGNSVNIKLPPSVVKTTEQLTTTTLPSTGPGTSIAIGFSITTLIAYFFARSRLFATELDIVRHEYAQVGAL